MRTARNFIVANICALLPMLWAGLGWMPDQVKVAWRGEEANPVAILHDGMVLQGEDYGRWEEGRVWRFYLREGMSWKKLAFRLPAGKGAGDVGRIDLQKWKLARWSKDGTGLEPADDLENGWRFGKSRFGSLGFASRGVACGLMGLEVWLLGLSWLFARFHREEAWKTLCPSAALVALALTALMQVALPVQSYWANPSAYPFSAGELCGAVAMRFAWVFALSLVAIGSLARCFGRWVLGAALAFAVCVYLESGILSAGLPELNGEWWFFRNPTRAMWDAAAWGGVFAVFAALHPIMGKRHGLVALCLLAMVAASMFDVNQEQKADTSSLIVHDFSPIETVVRSVEYSTNRNVLVFVIDSLEREQAHAIMEDPEAGPALREQFRGFTEYVDNVGATMGSEFGVANLFTGKYQEGVKGLANYFVSVYGSTSVLADYLEAGWDVHAATSALGYGFTTGKGGTAGAAEARDGKWGLGDVVRFRWVPFGAKWRCAQITELGKWHGGGIGRERVAYPILATGKIHGESCGSFVFVHTKGVHWSVRWDREGNQLAGSDDTWAGAVEGGIYVMRQLGWLMDAYRERGLYDHSLVVVLADHGNHGHGADEPDGLPGMARPFLWVKPPGSRHEFSSSHLPTTHAKVSALLREASRRAVGEDEVGEILASERRLYRQVRGLARKDWWVEPDGQVTVEEGRLEGVDGSLAPLEPGRTYSFDLTSTGAEALGDIELDGFFLRFWPRWFKGREEVRIRFRVPETGKRWRVRLTILPWMWSPDETKDNDRNARFRFRTSGAANETKALGEVVLRGVESDENGFVGITVVREEGIRTMCRLTQLSVEEEK